MNGPVRPDALGDGQSPAAGGDGGRGLEPHVPDIFLVPPAQFQFIPKTRSGQQAGDRTLHLDQGIVGHRGAMDDGLGIGQQFSQGNAPGLGELLQTRHDGPGIVFGRTRDLLQQHLVTVEKREVRKRSTHIDPDSVAQGADSRAARNSSRSLRVASTSNSRS